MKVLLSISLILMTLIFTGCNPVKGIRDTENAVAKFHALFDAQDYERIFESAHSDFKTSQPKDDTIQFIRSVREQLGKVKSAKRTGFHANSQNLENVVVLTFKTEFENGNGVETFTYRIIDGKPILHAWHIDANTHNPQPAKEETTH